MATTPADPPRGAPRTAPPEGSRPRSRPGRDGAAPRRAYVEDDSKPVDWFAPFRPVHSAKPGTMPAGMVLFVVVAGMVVALFMTAPIIAQKAGGRRNNAPWRVTMADAVAKVSDTFGLDKPAESLDEVAGPILGRAERTSDKSTDELLAEARAAGTAPAGPDGAASQNGGTAPGNVTTTTADPRPKLPVPTPDKPLKLFVGGDSISYDLGNSVEAIALESKLFTVLKDSRPSTGLTRPDYFNWPERLYRDIALAYDPDVVIVQFGSNDAQNIPMPMPIGGYVLGTEEWRTEYRKRVGDTMDLLRSQQNDRVVIWVGTPIMGPTSGVKEQPAINYIFATEAKKRPWVRYFDAWPYFTGAEGEYTKNAPNADGVDHVLRAGDNIHMSSWGADRLAWAVWQKLGTLMDLSHAMVQPDPAEMAPPEVQERPEVPPAEGQTPV